MLLHIKILGGSVPGPCAGVAGRLPDVDRLAGHPGDGAALLNGQKFPSTVRPEGLDVQKEAHLQKTILLRN